MYNPDIPVVQGEVVSPYYGQNSIPLKTDTKADYSFSYNSTNNTYQDPNFLKGTLQTPKYNDLAFSAAFIIHASIMTILFITSVDVSGDNLNTSLGFIAFVLCIAVIAILLSISVLGFMMNKSTELVKSSLYFSIGCNITVSILGFLTGQFMMGGLGLLCTALSICYTYCVWNRIPFASMNLKVSLTAVKCNKGLYLSSLVFLLVGVISTVGWSMITKNLYNYGTGVIFLFLLSLFWTHEVIRNTLHVTSAGVIGTWWFTGNEHDNKLCNETLRDSFKRSVTYSFGSICFGSLLVSIVQSLRHLQHIMRNDENFDFVVCIVDCILGCLESILEYINKWAYVYVGLYGYSYLEAGKNVYTLFLNKGWSSIISDDLAENVLLMISVGIALCSGLTGAIICYMDPYIVSDYQFGDSGLVGFIIGTIIGFVLSSIMLNVVGSAITTVIVCFAESPEEFERNQPKLSREMREAWKQAWPLECGF